MKNVIYLFHSFILFIFVLLFSCHRQTSLQFKCYGFKLLLDIFWYILISTSYFTFFYKAGRLHDFNNYVMSDNANPMISTDKELCWAFDGTVAEGATVELTCSSLLSGRLIYFIIIYSSLYSEQFHIHDFVTCRAMLNYVYLC